MPNLSWMEKLIIGRKITTDCVDIGFASKVFFVLSMLRTFIQ